MRINGVWHECDDGVTRPLIVVAVVGLSGTKVDERFLIDSGADRTAFSATLLDQLGGANIAAPAGVSLSGIGGTQAFVQAQAELRLIREDGGTAIFQGGFAAFTDPTATDYSILGRDVLDHFDVILSRRRDEILLLAPPSRFEVH
jgi:hypothetical protein